MVPLNGLHGDICVVGGFTTTMVQERARNHDPMHVPYGIAWRKQPQHATEQLTTTPQIRRREQLQQARQKLQDGKRLATFFHDKKRTYDEMSPSEQQLWEDFDTGKCVKHVRAKQVERLQPFRSSSE